LFVKVFSWVFRGALGEAVDGGGDRSYRRGRSGSGFSEVPVFRVQPATLDLKSRPWLPSRAASAVSGGVGDEVAVDGIADASLQRADRGSAGHPVGALAVIEPAAGAVAMPELGDRGDVDHVVQGPVPAA
jgi:hypothetical protein